MIRYKFFIIYLIASLFIVSCNKDEGLSTNPYEGSIEPLGIVFEKDAAPNPSSGGAGTIVEYQVSGLLPYKDVCKVFMSNTEVEIVEISNSILKIKLPGGVSTGNIKVMVDSQLFTGPLFTVMGKTKIDPSFVSGYGTNGMVNTIVPLSTSPLVYMVGGFFSVYNLTGVASPLGSLVFINANGSTHANFNTEGGATLTDRFPGFVNAIAKVGTDRILFSGSFPRYGIYDLVKSMALTDLTGKILTHTVDVQNNTEDESASTMIVPTFNGGAMAGILRTFVHNDKIIVVGNFSGYASNYYPLSTIDEILSDNFPIGGLMRLNLDGSIDETYFVDHSKFPIQGYPGAGGTISGAEFNLADGKVLLAGNFNTFNGSPANNIARVNADGTFDTGFAAGQGANGAIQSLTVSPVDNSLYFITGNFKSYNGTAVNNMCAINYNGTLNASFQAEAFEGGIPIYAKQLSNGLILVSGTFKKYGNIVREGFVILNADGSLAEDYNNLGKVDGLVNAIYESKNANNETIVLIGGSFSSFGGLSDSRNLVRILLEN